MDNRAAVMRQKMDETRAGLTDKLEELEHQVSGTVQTVKDSVNTVLNALDLRLHVRRRPWTLVAGATVLGFLGGFRSSNRRAAHPTRNGQHVSAPRSAAPAASAQPRSEGDDDTNGVEIARTSACAAPGWLAKLGETFQPEIAELRGFAIGTLLDVARDIITKATSKPVERSAWSTKDGGNVNLGNEIDPASSGDPLKRNKASM